MDQSKRRIKIFEKNSWGQYKENGCTKNSYKKIAQILWRKRSQNQGKNKKTSEFKSKMRIIEKVK